MKPLTRLVAEPTFGAISVQFIFSEALSRSGSDGGGTLSQRDDSRRQVFVRLEDLFGSQWIHLIILTE